MTHAHLIKSVSRELREVLGRIKMPEEYALEPRDYQTVNIFEQYLPKNLFDETTYYPMVLVEWLGTRESLKETSKAEVGITIGVYAHEEMGWQDAFYLLELIRGQLLTKRLIARRFRLIGDVQWTVPENQATPFFFIYGVLTYEIFQPQERI